jgi:hypothetical protein
MVLPTPRVFGPQGSFKRGGAYYSPTTNTGQSDPVPGVAQIIEHFRTWTFINDGFV